MGIQLENDTNNPNVHTELDSPATKHFAMTPHDSTNESNYTRGVYIGGSGNLTIVTDDDVAVAYSNAVAGTIIPIRAKRVNSTGLTASNLVGMY